MHITTLKSATKQKHGEERQHAHFIPLQLTQRYQVMQQGEYKFYLDKTNCSWTINNKHSMESWRPNQLVLKES